MFDRFQSIPWAHNTLGRDYTRVVNMPRFCVNCILKILSVLNVMSSEGFECFRNLNMLYLRVLNINTSSYLFYRILNIPQSQNMPEL